jgi:hypothetical protein
MKISYLGLIIVTLSAVTSLSVSALAPARRSLPILSQMLKPRAYFVEGENGLYEALDLKAKSLTTRIVISDCGDNLERKARTLDYSCKIQIPSKAKISRLQNLVTTDNYEVTLGGLKKEVTISVASDARTITYSTKFDSTGIDFDVMKFNDDFFASNAKLAHIVLAEAMKQPVRIEVLESK